MSRCSFFKRPLKRSRREGRKAERKRKENRQGRNIYIQINRYVSFGLIDLSSG
jgi:hypothetical protein